MAGPSFRLNDTEIIDYFDECGSDDEYLCDESESECDSVNNEIDAQNESDSDDVMEDEDYREVFAPEQPLLLPHIFQELPGPKHMPNVGSPPVTYFYYCLQIVYSN